jgi:GNAT superfamily N-acetyltransferase
MRREDLPTIHSLLRQLGYEMDANEVSRRFSLVANTADHTLLIAESQDGPVAFLHAFIRPALEKPPEAIVQALVVDEKCRKTGIGKRLMAFAERWALERGFSSVALSSHSARKESHAFYKRLGYDEYATSHSFRKKAG